MQKRVTSRAADEKQESHDLVSVVIPCFNHARFLGDAIESVLGQSYSPIEVVVVDDGSEDDTASLAARYPSVRLVRQSNLGLAAARNSGWRTSTGASLVFLDADDRLLPDALESGMRCLRQHPGCGFVFGCYRDVTLDGQIIREPVKLEVERDPYLQFLRGASIAMHATVMFRRSSIEAVGGYDSSLRACEDYDLYLRITRTFPIFGHNAVVAEYRAHETNMSLDQARMLKWVLTALRKQEKLVNGSADRRAAYEDGLAFWRDWYGTHLAESIRARLRAREWRPAATEMLVLLRFSPVHAPRAMRWRRAVRHLVGHARHKRRDDAARSFRWGDLRRTEPVSRHFGYDRGQPVDRRYVEEFLEKHSQDVRGRVLEIGDDAYTRQFGGRNVIASDVLHVNEGEPGVTIVADLTSAPQIPSNTFDCIICTQTLHLIFDAPAAIRTMHRILKPGGVLLTTFPGISSIASGIWGDTWYWSFTSRSAWRMFTNTFSSTHCEVSASGNVLTAIAFLEGLAAEELAPAEFTVQDPSYEVVVFVRAVKDQAAA